MRSVDELTFQRCLFDQMDSLSLTVFWDRNEQNLGPNYTSTVIGNKVESISLCQILRRIDQ